MGKKWVPLESNPEVLNQFARTLGFDVRTYAFCDVLGLDEVRDAALAPHRAAATLPITCAISACWSVKVRVQFFSMDMRC